MSKKEEKVIVNNTVSEWYNKWIFKLDEKYDKLLNAKKRFCYNISDLFLSDYDYDDFFVPPLETDKKVSPMPPLEIDENEVNERKERF